MLGTGVAQAQPVQPPHTSATARTPDIPWQGGPDNPDIIWHGGPDKP